MASSHSGRDGNALTGTQIVILVVIGAVLWFGAALLLRAIGTLEGAKVAMVYALTIPGTVPFVILLRKSASLRRDQTALGVTIATGTAGLLDGTALAWFRPLYGVDPLGAAAAILWGAGVALILGVVMNKPERG